MWASLGCCGPGSCEPLGSCGPGPCWPGPCGLPWALMAKALVGPWAFWGDAQMGVNVPNWNEREREKERKRQRESETEREREREAERERESESGRTRKREKEREEEEEAEADCLGQSLTQQNKDVIFLEGPGAGQPGCAPTEKAWLSLQQ